MSEYKEFDPKSRKAYQKEMQSYKVVPEIIEKRGYPNTAKGYEQAHKETNKLERKQYGNRRFEALEKVMQKKLSRGELAGHITSEGKVTVSNKIPEKYHGEIAFHEKTEHKILQRKKLIRKQKRINRRR